MRSRLIASAVLLGIAVAFASCAPTAAEQSVLPMAYLKQARQAARVHDGPKALAALNAAEQTWMTNNGEYGGFDNSIDPGVLREMARARQSVQMGLWGDALYYINTAMKHPSTIWPP